MAKRRRNLPSVAVSAPNRRRYPEHDLQCAVMEWAGLQRTKWPELRWLYATMQPSKLTPRQAHRFKLAGIKAGIPDLHLPVPILHTPPSQEFTPGLWIELKGPRTALSATQKEWHAALTELGHEVWICRDLESAIDIITDYLARVYTSRRTEG